MVLVDSNVLIDIFGRDAEWFAWSEAQFREIGLRERMGINPIIYAELSCAFGSAKEVDEQLENLLIEKLPLPCEAGFLAGRAFLKYRQLGGRKRSPLPDFYVGAHASVARIGLLTRDAARYGSYFPDVRLYCPQ